MKFMFLLFLSLLLTGCGTSTYWLDRGHDMTDIVTITVGTGLGAKVRIGILQTGLLGNVDFAGLRGGSLFWDDDLMSHGVDIAYPIPIPTEWGTFTVMESFCTKPTPKSEDPRGKDFEANSNLPLLAFGNKAYYYTQLEVVAGLFRTVRLGFNPGELLDFMMGWMTIDIFSDDIGKIVPPNHDCFMIPDNKTDS